MSFDHKPRTWIKGCLLLASLSSMAPFALAGDVLYASTSATQSYTTFIGPIPIDGLGLTLPAANQNFNAALVTLDLPNLFLSNSTSRTAPMAGQIFLQAPFAPQGFLEAAGGIGCDNVNVKTSGLKPLSLVLLVPLGSTPQPVQAEWNSNGSSTITTQTFASISAVLVKQ